MRALHEFTNVSGSSADLDASDRNYSVVQYMYRCTYLLSLIDIHAHARTLRIQMSFNFLQTRTVFSVTPWVGVENLCMIRPN